MSKKDVDAIRARSKASGSGPWVTDYVEMARKTVLKRACKYLPMAIEINDALDQDTKTEFGEPEPIEINLGEANVILPVEEKLDGEVSDEN
jgi:recombination protein RecT